MQLMETKPRIEYTHFGACGNCPPGKEYSPQINLKHFKTIQQIITAVIALIDHHNSAKHPGKELRTEGIM